MREIFFNSFKEKILNGQVPQSFDVTGVPVNSKFFDSYDNTDIAIEQYKNLSDFDTYARNVSGIPKFKDTMFEYSSYGVEYSAYQNDDIGEKPIFVNAVNSAKFFEIYGEDFDAGGSARMFEYMTLRNEDDVEEKEELRNTNSGFYYVTKKSQLHWLADRCNDENNYNNKIRIVLGDDIGNLNDMDTLESMICTTPERPFQGIFDMNGHKLINKKFICNQNSNGLIGYLGPKGIVRNGIVENITFVNQKKISLDKIVNDCSDVVVGALVGTNFGTVENIITSGRMEFNGFCPEVYLVNNKYEYQFGDSTNNNSAYNGFFPNKFCINSIYNVLPYCGYFNEGADSFFNDIGRSNYWMPMENRNAIGPDTSMSVNTTNLMRDDAIGNIGFSRASFCDEYSLEFYPGFHHYDEPKQSISDGYDQSQIKMIPAMCMGKDGWFETSIAQNIQEKLADLAVCPDTSDQYGRASNYFIAPMLSLEYTQQFLDRVLANTINSLGKWQAYDNPEVTYDISSVEVNNEFDMYMKDISYASYLAQQLRDIVQITRDTESKFTPHQRMNPNVRIAYYCSPIVGNNFGTIRNIDALNSIHESRDTFVGFIGNVCGKQNCGSIYYINSVLDIVENNMFGEDSGAKNLSRTYTKQKKYLPDYSSSYANLSQAFAYNWDYFQTSAGISQEELSAYSAVSGDSVTVSEKFYDFHDFVCSGVNGSWYKDTGTRPGFVFNRYANKTAKYLNCNFKVSDEEDLSDIGATVPVEIRNAKMKFAPEDDGSMFKLYYELEVPSFTSGTSGEEDFYEKIYPFQGEVKIFNDFEDEWNSNTQFPFVAIDKDGDTIKSELQNILNLDIKHMSVDYLGDAAKTVMGNDKPSYFGTGTKADGSTYQITMDDVLKYSPAFVSSAGSTIAGANEFARNMMNAKIAMGADLLGSQSLDPEFPFSGWNGDPIADENGPFGIQNKVGVDQWDVRSAELFVIPAGKGPNDTQNDWNIFAFNNNLHGMAWYGSPASNQYPNGSPKPRNPVQVGYEIPINIHAYKPSKFCTTDEEMLWDVCNRNMDFEASSGYFDDGSMWRTSAYNESQRNNLKNFALQRSMVTVEPIQNSDNEIKARTLAIWLAENTTILRMLSKDSSLVGDSTDLSTLFGSNWSAVINTIRIPMFNRTQNRTEVKENFEGVDGITGMYYKQIHGITRQVVDRVDGEYHTVITEKWKNLFRNHFPKNIAFLDNELTEKTIGNIDDMFVDMTILEKVADRRFKKYNVIFRLPLKSIRIPISAFKVVDGVSVVDTTRFTDNFAYDGKIVQGVTDKHKERNINFYPLVPAYDPSDTNGRYVDYKLKSIYNVGGICGMINHSEKNIEYGNHVKLASGNYGVNKAAVGTIFNANLRITTATANFINRLCMITRDYDGSYRDTNDRVIGLASKFAMVAPVYEYHQNEIGTSPDPGLGDEYNTNGLTRIDLDVQSMYIHNIHIAGNRNVNLSNINSRLFKPIIEWSNVSNILDYNNFLDFRYLQKSDNSMYLGHSSSNYPESVNILHNYCSCAAGDRPIYFTDQNCKLLGMGQQYLSRRSFPLYSMERVSTPDGDAMYGFVSPSGWYSGGPDFSETIASMELYYFGKFYYDNARFDSIRNRLHYGYEKFPEFTLRLLEVYVYENGTEVGDLEMNHIHMSRAALSPNSDYYDVYNQLLDGSPNFCFTKLNKSLWLCDLPIVNRMNPTLPTDWKPEMYNLGMMTLYGKRTADNVRDRYFTWDYDMRQIKNEDLKFNIQYKRVNTKRGLWIHQINDKIDNSDYLKYAMKGADQCINDGSNIHLGYMPSEWALINIMNREDDNSRPQNQFDEGVAIDGEDYRGMLLYDDNRDLVAIIDAGAARDITSGCYVAQLPKTVDIGGKRYGLLTEIEVE